MLTELSGSCFLPFRIYRLSRSLGESRQQAYVQVIGFFCLFGTNVFSFRYYELSSTPLAYVAYLEALILILRTGGRARGWLKKAFCILFLLLPLMIFNHIQEPLLFLISGSVALLYFCFEGIQSEEGRSRFLKVLIGIIVTGFVLGPLLRLFFPHLYSTVGVGNFNRLGALHLSERTFLETYGVHGLLSLALAVLLFRKHRLLSLLSLAPTFTLIFPPTALAAETIIRNHYATYRVLFAMPLSMILVAALFDLLAFLRKGSSEINALAAGVIILLLSADPRYPWRGRLYFQFYRPPPILSLRPFVETAQWLKEKKHFDSHSIFLTDPMTAMALSGYLGMPPRTWGHRIEPSAFLKLQDENHTREKLLPLFKEYYWNSILILDAERFSRERSPIAALSHHWDPSNTDPRALLRPAFVSNLDQMVRDGYLTRVSVPPYHFLYEPVGK